MAASDGQIELNTTSDDSFPNRHELTAAASSRDDDAMTGDQEVDLESRFVCPHCSKSYTTRKSLTRHLSGTNAVCANRHEETQMQDLKSQQKVRWACSRCGKNCATIHSIERHIKNSCWRTCDECTADGATHCDSTTRAGACRTCEAKERPCTKYASVIPGSMPQPWTDPAARPCKISSADEDAVATAQQKQLKREAPTDPKRSPEAAQKNKRRAQASQQPVDHGLGRIYDPLGGQAYVPPVVKKAAVSTWLEEQQKKNPSSAASTQENIPNKLPLLAQAVSTQMRYDGQISDRFVKQSHLFSCAPPSLANGLSSQPSCEQALSLLPSFPGHRMTGHDLIISPRTTSIPDPSPFGSASIPAADGPVQPDHLFHQMQTSGQDAILNCNMTMQFDPRNGVVPPLPLVSCDPFNLNRGLQVPQTQIVCNPTTESTSLGQNDAILTLRIHSNTHDMNHQPIFSILRIRRNEIFGPRLNAYCINRGKEYGKHWIFIYCYKAAAHQANENHLQVTLTWDMTPDDVKDDDFPGMKMRNLDTIYVMQARPLTLVGTKDLNEDCNMQLPGHQMSHGLVDIINGETNVFQNPDVSREWYQAIEKDAAHLRALHSTMKSINIQQMLQISNKDKMIAQLQNSITQLTTLSSQLRERIQLPLPNYTTQVHVSTSSKAPAGRVIRQRPGPSHAQQHPTANLTAFVAKCEAVRNTQMAGVQQLEPLHFPRSSSDFAVPSHGYQTSVNSSHDDKVRHLGHVNNPVDGAVGEDRV